MDKNYETEGVLLEKESDDSSPSNKPYRLQIAVG